MAAFLRRNENRFCQHQDLAAASITPLLPLLTPLLPLQTTILIDTLAGQGTNCRVAHFPHQLVLTLRSHSVVLFHLTPGEFKRRLIS